MSENQGPITPGQRALELYYAQRAGCKKHHNGAGRICVDCVADEIAVLRDALDRMKQERDLEWRTAMHAEDLVWNGDILGIVKWFKQSCTHRLEHDLREAKDALDRELREGRNDMLRWIQASLEQYPNGGGVTPEMVRAAMDQLWREAAEAMREASAQCAADFRCHGYPGTFYEAIPIAIRALPCPAPPTAPPAASATPWFYAIAEPNGSWYTDSDTCVYSSCSEAQMHVDDLNDELPEDAKNKYYVVPMYRASQPAPPQDGKKKK